MGQFQNLWVREIRITGVGAEGIQDRATEVNRTAGRSPHSFWCFPTTPHSSLRSCPTTLLACLFHDLPTVSDTAARRIALESESAAVWERTWRDETWWKNSEDTGGWS